MVTRGGGGVGGGEGWAPPSALALTYVREKKKEKMLHKLGMGMGRRSRGEGRGGEEGDASRTVPDLTRIICSAKASTLRGSLPSCPPASLPRAEAEGSSVECSSTAWSGGA